MNIDKENNITKKEVTLKDFLIKEHKLISSLGVFIALTIFSQSFLKGRFGEALSLLFLFLSILIFFELWEQFPRKGGSAKLALFESYLSISSIFIFLYWLYRMKELNKDFVIFVLSLLLYGPIMFIISNYIIKKFEVFNKLFRAKDDEKKLFRYFFGYILMIAIFFIVYAFLYSFKDYIINFLNYLFI